MSTVATEIPFVHPERWIDETDASDPAPTFSATGFADEEPPIYEASEEDIRECQIVFSGFEIVRQLELARARLRDAMPGADVVLRRDFIVEAAAKPTDVIGIALRDPVRGFVTGFSGEPTELPALEAKAVATWQEWQGRVAWYAAGEGRVVA